MEPRRRGYGRPVDTSESFGDLAPDLVDEGVLSPADLDDGSADRPPQLYEPDDPFEPDSEAAMVAEAGLEAGDGVPAEEAAMRIEEDPGGLNYDDSPGYLD